MRRRCISEEQAAYSGDIPDEGVQAFAINVDETLQAASRRVLSSLHLYGTDHENLADGTAALTATVWFVLAPGRPVRLVDLNDPTKPTPVGIDHCPPKLVK